MRSSIRRLQQAALSLIHILLGKYGQTVKPFNPEIVDKVLGEEKKNAITCRPADLLEPELDKIEEMCIRDSLRCAGHAPVGLSKRGRDTESDANIQPEEMLTFFSNEYSICIST